MAKNIKPWPDVVKQYLRDTTACDPVSGLLTWRCDHKNHRAGQPRKLSPHNVDSKRYLKFGVTIDGIRYQFLAHHVVWFLHHGYQSLNLIDHIDGNGQNLRPDNLRDSNTRLNTYNRKKRQGSQNTLKGVVCTPSKNRFYAQIRANNTVTRLGKFSNEEEAARHYDLASIVLHGDHGSRNFPDSDYSPAQVQAMRDYIQNKAA